MSGRGRRDRDNNCWSKTFKTPRPRGLRGRDIGLYYRNQNRKGSKGPKLNPVVQLTIPPAVISSLENNIKTIKALAEKHNVPITKFNGLNIIKPTNNEENASNSTPLQLSETDMFSQPSTSRVAGEGSSNSNIIKTEPITCKDVGNDDKSQVNIFKIPEPTANTSNDEATNIKEEPMDVTDIKNENVDISEDRILSLRGAGDFKYGYEDIITGTFDDKLDVCLSKDLTITKKDVETDDLCVALYQDYLNMIESTGYKKHKQFRETLPAYKKANDLLEVINNNQVVVISGETGCGKSTQVPQLILDQAIEKQRGGYIKILVTQPRRIAASSLAMRVAQERSESMGNAVGYAVRLEKVDARPRGSIMFCTTGILLATLEIDQALSNYTHIILDEVHERDCDIDLAMFMLRKVLNKRKDLKLILMSATIDANTLSTYFNNCPKIHIEGLAYPVKDIYLEEILQLTGYKLPVGNSPNPKNVKPWHRHIKKRLTCEMEKDIQYKAQIAPWLESIKGKISQDVYKTLQDHRIEDLNIDLIHDLLAYISKGPAGAILVFLPGIVDISKLIRKMQASKCFPSNLFAIYPLHSKLPSLQQHQIFEKPPGSMRKIIVATNIAETSITIDDIVYVVDCGRIKYSGLKVEENISTLLTEWVSQANLRQRRGRAGRCQPGICYHLMTSHRAKQLDERLLPELQRNSLLEPVLSIKRLRLGNAADALLKMPAPPADRTVGLAVLHLQQCGALDYEEKLTPLGWHMARLPVHPAAGKLLLLGSLFGCLDRAASVAAVWGFKDPFHIVIGKEEEVDQSKKDFALGEGSDHVAISEAIRQWEKLPSEQQKHFAYTKFLAHNTLELLSDMKKQFGTNLQQMGFLASGDIFSQWENRNNNNLSLFKAIIAASLYPNIATAKWSNTNTRNPNKMLRVKARTPEGRYIQIHPSSVMAVKKPKRGYSSSIACVSPGASWIVYWTKQQSLDLFLIEITLIHTLPLLFFGELSVTEADNPDDCFISITSIRVRCRRRTAELLFQMRSLLDQVLAAKIGISSTHATVKNPFEDQVLKAVKELITAEDERADYLNDDDTSESDNSEFETNMAWC